MPMKSVPGAAALAVLIPLFVFTFGRIVGAPYPEVLAYFKSTGEGWQSLMDSVLRQYVASHSRP